MQSENYSIFTENVVPPRRLSSPAAARSSSAPRIPLWHFSKHLMDIKNNHGFDINWYRPWPKLTANPNTIINNAQFIHPTTNHQDLCIQSTKNLRTKMENYTLTWMFLEAQNMKSQPKFVVEHVNDPKMQRKSVCKYVKK